MATPYVLEGSIAGAGFASGDRVVIGHWQKSPIGAFSDVMWAEADDWRTLFVATERARDFVSSVYEFDSTFVISELYVDRIKKQLRASWPGAQMEFDLGVAAPFPPRPAWVTQRIEKPIARAWLGVETHGVSPTGVEETYKAHRLRRIIGGWGVVAGRDLGTVGAPTPACRFGFSEPPPFASVTDVTATLTDSLGVLDRMFAAESSPSVPSTTNLEEADD